jgi:hypothetical protein
MQQIITSAIFLITVIGLALALTGQPLSLAYQGHVYSIIEGSTK